MKIQGRKEAKVLGIDCGLAITGWSVVASNLTNGNDYNVYGYGAITTSKNDKIEIRLVEIYRQLLKIIKKYKVDSVAVESLFYFKNQKTVMSVGQARGVILLCASLNNLEVFNYTPLQVKQAVSGYGKATKHQVQKMVESILKLKDVPSLDDVTDALAVAICHLNTVN